MRVGLLPSPWCRGPCHRDLLGAIQGACAAEVPALQGILWWCVAGPWRGLPGITGDSGGLRHWGIPVPEGASAWRGGCTRSLHLSRGGASVLPQAWQWAVPSLVWSCLPSTSARRLRSAAAATPSRCPGRARHRLRVRGLEGVASPPALKAAPATGPGAKLTSFPQSKRSFSVGARVMLKRDNHLTPPADHCRSGTICQTDGHP